MRLMEIIQGTVKTEKRESPRTELWGFALTLNKEVKGQRDEGEPPKNTRRGAIRGWHTVASQVDKVFHSGEGAQLQQALPTQIKKDKDWKTTGFTMMLSMTALPGAGVLQWEKLWLDSRLKEEGERNGRQQVLATLYFQMPVNIWVCLL